MLKLIKTNELNELKYDLGEALSRRDSFKGITTNVGVSKFHDFLNDENSSYHDYFTYNGAIIVFEFLESQAQDLGENLDYDPISWCCEFDEFEDFEDFKANSGYVCENIEELDENTLVISEMPLIFQAY